MGGESVVLEREVRAEVAAPALSPRERALRHQPRERVRAPGEPPEPGSQIGRQACCPVGGPTTLKDYAKAAK